MVHNVHRTDAHTQTHTYACTYKHTRICTHKHNTNMYETTLTKCSHILYFAHLWCYCTKG